MNIKNICELNQKINYVYVCKSIIFIIFSDKLVSVMAQIGNFNIQRSIFELIIRYSCTQFNEISKPIIIDIFESNGFLDIENALAEFNFQTLRQVCFLKVTFHVISFY